MPELDPETVNQYVEQVLRLRDERAEALSPGELREIALDLGLTDADLDAVERTV